MAKHRPLWEVNRGTFREDLYYRLAKMSLRVPPLRDRSEDVSLLVDSLLGALDPRSSAHLFSPSVLAEMPSHEWPGNVRELRVAHVDEDRVANVLQQWCVNTM
jgi:transcriptional regulator with PAS, ATPase and Fis domain